MKPDKIDKTQKRHVPQILGRVFHQKKAPAGDPLSAKSLEKQKDLSTLRNDKIQGHSTAYIHPFGPFYAAN